MKLTGEDQRLLQQLCEEHRVSYDKVLKLLDTVKEYEFKDRRHGIYEALKEIVAGGIKA